MRIAHNLFEPRKSFWETQSLGAAGKWCGRNRQWEILLFQWNNREIHPSSRSPRIPKRRINRKRRTETDWPPTRSNELLDISGFDIQVRNVRNRGALPPGRALCRGAKAKFSPCLYGLPPHAVFGNSQKFLPRVWYDEAIFFQMAYSKFVNTVCKMYKAHVKFLTIQ